MDNRPIGVFDSGLGGLTTVRELQALLPNEDIVYFGDTGRNPYGPRSRDIILEYASQDIAFLLSQNVKMIIAACGTVSSNLPPETTEAFAFPFCDIVVPSAEAACAASRSGKIGVIGTQATINSGAFERAIGAIRPETTIISNACPLFIPLVENGFIDRDCEITRLAAEQYLKPFHGTVDTLILGCTHFPVIQDIIADILGPEITLINSGLEAARQTQTILAKQNMLTEKTHPGKTVYYVSDNMQAFAEIGAICLGKEIDGDVSFIRLDNH